jgi:Ketopantoate reductase PanE/ApbA C terminal
MHSDLEDIAFFPTKTLSALSMDAMVTQLRHLGDRWASLMPHNKISALQDVERGKRLEVEETLGYAVRQSAVLGIPTPTMDTCYKLTLIGSRALSQLHPDSISIMWLLNFHGSNLMNSELTSCALKAFIHRGLWHFPNPASGRKIYLTWDKTSSPLVSINPL